MIGPDTTLKDCEIGAGARVVRTHGELAVIGDGANVGPFAYLRPGTTLGADGKIGTFVETKNAADRRRRQGAAPVLRRRRRDRRGQPTSAPARSSPTTTASQKHRTVVGRHARTGANNTFVAPVEIGDGAGTAGGTVVRRDVPPGALAVSGGPQRNLARLGAHQAGRDRPGGRGGRGRLDGRGRRSPDDVRD